MKKLSYSSAVKRIDASSPREIEMMREAIRGDKDAGKYLRDMGVGALSGAAGGALFGGASAVPGAIVGGLWGLGSNLGSDIWYDTRSDEEKAAWQASDLQELLQKMGSYLFNKTQVDKISNTLNELGNEYKNYIDVVLRKNNGKEQLEQYQKNRFNPNTSGYTEFNKTYNRTASNKKFIRVVESADSSPASTIGGMGGMVAGQQFTDKLKSPAVVTQNSKIPITSEMLFNFFKDENSVSPPVKAQIQKYLQANPTLAHDYAQGFTQSLNNNPSKILFNGADDIAGQAAKQIAKPGFWKNVGTGIKGLGVGWGVEFAANWGLDKIDMAMTGGEINMFRKELSDISKIITEINRLSKNESSIVYAGNMLWTNLKEIDRMLSLIENKKAQEENNTNVENKESTNIVT
jgi:hypothetical protein